MDGNVRKIQADNNISDHGMGLKDVNYIIISPVKNEAAYIGGTISSVVAQTVCPREWIIVDDGSTDETPQILSRSAKAHAWIKTLRLQGQERRRGGHVVRLFNNGLSLAETKDPDYIVKLDCDLSFGPDFFASIFSFFASNPRLGISSGVSHINRNGTLVEEKSTPGHTLGATKVYRKSCLDSIGGLVEAMGWDGIDEVKARMLGWEAAPVRGLAVVHHRPEGMAHGPFKSGIERGRGAYFMGYHPLYLALRAVRRMFASPPLLDGLGMLLGYVGAALSDETRIPDTEFIEFLRKNQLKKLFFMEHKA